QSHVEAYELLRSRDGADLAFGEFLKELAATYRAASVGHGRVAAALAIPPPTEYPDPPSDPAGLAEQQEILAAARQSLPPADRPANPVFPTPWAPLTRRPVATSRTAPPVAPRSAGLEKRPDRCGRRCRSSA